VGDYLKYYRVADEHIVIVDDAFGNVFPINIDYETINNFIAEHFEFSCYNFEDKGEYWEFIETEEEEYTEDYVELKMIRIDEVLRIEDLISKAIDTKQPQPFEEGDAYEIDIEYLKEENHNLFEAAVVLKYCNNPEKYFPIKGTYDSISGVLKGEGDDILHSIADQIYTHYYGEEDNFEE
jgi:hypothetical protein